MLQRNGRTVACARRARSVAALVLAAACVPASLAVAAPDSGQQPAAWVQKELNFRYVGFTTKYSCDGLRERMRGLLLKLGARADLKMTGYGCVGANSPETAPGVRVVMQVLQPASAAGGGQTAAAHWKSVDLLADRDLLDAARDCELIAQIDREVLPLFAVRNVDYSAACSVHTPLVGGTKLKAQVLVTD